MRKILFLALLIALSVLVKAQTPTHIATFPGITYVYIGSLVQASNSSANSQKLVVKIYGAGWYSGSNGETTLYIANREGLTVKEVSQGTSISGWISLKAYQNGTNTDFYLVANPLQYTSFAVSSYSFGYTLTPQYVTITTQNTVPTTTDITSSFESKPYFITTEGGNIGIGTADPKGYKLAVAGNMIAESVKVKLKAAWPDFVFAKSYALPTLKETESHIKEKGHLPGIPSAAEVEANGIDLGNMDAKLLQKIEELTLHLIRQEKEIQELKQKMESNKKSTNH